MKRAGHVIAIVGPTCTGKTSLSLELARLLNGEIVACDSRTIYKHMDIGTAKPTAVEQAMVRHHAIDVLAPNRFYSVAEYKELAGAAVDDILGRGKLPIVCGGTGLYARALLEGIEIPPVPPQPQIREYLDELAATKGNQHLHDKLKEVDALTANRLSINDRRRIIRALEVSMVTGRAFSSLAVKREPPFKTIWVGLSIEDRALHRQMIIRRLTDQFEQGLLEEVRTLAQEHEFRDILKSAVNYKEFIPYIDGIGSMEQVFEQCVLHNFQLARKQMIWFRANKEITWHALDEVSRQTIVARVSSAHADLAAGKG